MNLLRDLLFCIATVIPRSLAVYTYAFVPAVPSYPQWQQQMRLLYHSFLTAPSSAPYEDAFPPQFVRAPLNYLPARFQYTVYPHLQYYPPAIDDRKTVLPYPSGQTRKLQTIPADEELGSQETTEEDDSAPESTLFYQELLRAQLYRQLQAIKRAYRLRKAFEKVSTI